MRERHLLNRIQEQADRIIDLENQLQDYSVKWDLKNKKLEAELDEAFKENKKLNDILNFFDVKMKNNPEYQQLKADLIGGHEEKPQFCKDCKNLNSHIKCKECTFIGNQQSNFESK